MTELLAAIAILLGDWGCAMSHMAFKRVEFTRLYNEPCRFFGDHWHFVASWRYLPMALLAWMAFGYQWEWWVGTALVNSIGWYGLKVAHGKVDRWGWQPRWLKQVLGR